MIFTTPQFVFFFLLFFSIYGWLRGRARKQRRAETSDDSGLSEWSSG